MRLKSILLCVVGLYLFGANKVVIARAPQDTCAFPAGLGEGISKKYPGARLVTLADLDEYNRKLFQKDHGTRCPGLVRVNFYGDGKPTWALVLIAGEGSKPKAELVVAHKVGTDWEIRLLDTVDASEMPVVLREGPGTYDDVSEPKTVRAKNPVIELYAYEVWGKLYAWTGKDVVKLQISD
jgi:hypothetical protein